MKAQHCVYAMCVQVCVCVHSQGIVYPCDELNQEL